jgi:hypothetical protein
MSSASTNQEVSISFQKFSDRNPKICPKSQDAGALETYFRDPGYLVGDNGREKGKRISAIVNVKALSEVALGK